MAGEGRSADIAARGFRFRDEDDVRAAFGSFGYPGEEGVRNARMRGGFGGDGYQQLRRGYTAASTTGPGRGCLPKRYERLHDLPASAPRPGDDEQRERPPHAGSRAHLELS